MAKAFFNVLFQIITSVLNIVLLPINAVISNLFPDVSSLITQFNNLIDNVFGSGMVYFASILPPITKSIILFYLGVLVSYYTISISVHAFVKLFIVIRKIKFW